MDAVQHSVNPIKQLHVQIPGEAKGGATISPKWSKATSKKQAAVFLGVSVETVDARLKVNPKAVNKISRELWQFDKNDSLFSRLP